MTNEQKRMVADCLADKRISKCSDKEVDFLETLQKTEYATYKEITWLEGIWERATANG